MRSNTQKPNIKYILFSIIRKSLKTIAFDHNGQKNQKGTEWINTKKPN